MPLFIRRDTDSDGISDHFDPDDDNDGVPDTEDRDDDGDNIPDEHDPDHIDTDGDGLPDSADEDDDNDGILDRDDPDDNGDGIPDLFQARLGEAGLRCITLADDHRPELSWRAIAPSVAPDARMPDARMPTAGGYSDCAGVPGPRPLWLLPEPRRIADAPLQLLRGPERIDVAWWALAEQQPQRSAGVEIQTTGEWLAPTVARDYYIARDAQGVLCWVYRTHEANESSSWFLHGYFA